MEAKAILRQTINLMVGLTTIRKPVMIIGSSERKKAKLSKKHRKINTNLEHPPSSDNSLFSADELKWVNGSHKLSKIFKISGSVVVVIGIIVGIGTLAHGLSSNSSDVYHSANQSRSIPKYNSSDTGYDSDGSTADNSVTTTPDDSSSPTSSTPSSSSSIGSSTPDIVTPDTSAENAAMAQAEAQARQDEAQARQDEAAVNNPQESPAEVAMYQCVAQAKADYQPEIDEIINTAPGGETYNLSPSGIAGLKQLNNEYNNAIANCENQ